MFKFKNLKFDVVALIMSVIIIYTFIYRLAVALLLAKMTQPGVLSSHPTE
jgi:hypothetical protein